MPLDTTLSDAEAAVAQAWRERCGERRGPLEQADVDVIAEAAFHTPGVKPTVELIRRIAGGGSPNTIHPKLDAWFRRSRARSNATDTPAELVSLWERLQSAAVTAARAELEPIVEALSNDQALLEDNRRRLAADQATLVTERATTAALVADLREEFRALQARNDALADANDGLRHAAQANAGELAQHLATIERMRESLAAAATTHADVAAALEAMQKERDAWRDQCEQHRAALGEALAQLAELREAAAAATAREHRAEERLNELTAALEHARADAERQASAREGLDQALAVARAEALAGERLRDHLSAELIRERADLTALRGEAEQINRALAAERAGLAAVAAERDRLHRSLAHLAERARRADSRS